MIKIDEELMLEVVALVGQPQAKRWNDDTLSLLVYLRHQGYKFRQIAEVFDVKFDKYTWDAGAVASKYSKMSEVEKERYLSAIGG